MRFDPRELLAKYEEEKRKRLQNHPEGNAQYIDASTVLAGYNQDPLVGATPNRSPIIEETDVLIVGAGFGGLLTAAALARRGVKNIKIIDKAGDVGGTWYWNRYPGAACDIESYIYMPLLEETGYIPSEKYAKGVEIFEHCQRIARHFDLYPHAIFQTEVKGVKWDDGAKRWQVITSQDDRISARYIVIAGGIMHKPKLPGIPNIEKFKGHSFHTTRWDYSYTGGAPSVPMDKLGDKRVGIIGTGATAVQVVPKLAECSKKLFVFQRTPSGVAVRNNKPTSEEWAKSLKPGWQEARMENFASIMVGEAWGEDLVQDGWTEIFGRNKGATLSSQEQQLYDFKLMEEIRARVDAIVPDKATAEALKPWYNRMCKRPCFHDEYLQAFARPNVTLVDTAGKGIDRMTENGPVVNGTEFPLDVLIYASGFEMSTSYNKRLGFEIFGRNGHSLTDAWVNGPRTLHGAMTNGFPNLIMLGTTQGGYTVNFSHLLTRIADHASWIVSYCLENKVATIEPTVEAEKKWWEEVLGQIANSPGSSECTPGYYNNEGAEPDQYTLKSSPYSGRYSSFFEILQHWRSSEPLDGVKLTFQ